MCNYLRINTELRRNNYRIVGVGGTWWKKRTTMKRGLISQAKIAANQPDSTNSGEELLPRRRRLVTSGRRKEVRKGEKTS